MFSQTLADLITNFIVLIGAMTVHEFAHAYGAFLMGDPTAKEQGRMTLDPRANINPVGFLFAVLIGIGILGSAPVNRYRMRDPRWGMLFAVAAGPFSNLLLASVFAIPLALRIVEPEFSAASPLYPSISYVLTQMVWLNIIMFFFNLLPFFPLDGWTVALALFPTDLAIWWERNRQTNMIIGGLLLLSSFVFPGPFNPLSWVVFEPSILLLRLLVGLS